MLSHYIRGVNDNRLYEVDTPQYNTGTVQSRSLRLPNASNEYVSRYNGIYTTSFPAYYI